MPTFLYQALDGDGRQHRGRLEAADEAAAARELQGQGLLVLDLKRGARLFGERRRPSAFTPAERVRFTQQLATLIAAGQPLDKALTTLHRQLRGARPRALLEALRDDVKAGRPISAALARHAETFSPFYVSLVRAGEASGVLDETLAQLGDDLERSQNLRGEVINAMIYPLFLVVGVIGSVALLLTYVVPQFVPIFRDLGVPLPSVTRAILATSGFLNDWGLVMLLALVGLPTLLLAARRRPQTRLAQDRWLLRLRGLGPLIQRLETARLARTLGTLLGNGVTLLSALAIARDVGVNHAIRDHLQRATEAVKGGERFAVALETPPLLPELAVQMIDVGEHSGTLAEMLDKVAETFDVETRRTIERLLAALVPTLTLVMTVLVAVIMFAIMLPLMSLTSHI
ncbi:type II secretion system F family protein [Halomonas elongata]|uniref:type II secretion system F family protein n=1 Tax=Halomonas elongata TaxID=2746 RepID=UPI0040344B45